MFDIELVLSFWMPMTFSDLILIHYKLRSWSRFAGHEISASIEPVISPIILNMWASHVSDPFISIDALEVLEVNLLFSSLSFSECGFS